MYPDNTSANLEPLPREAESSTDIPVVSSWWDIFVSGIRDMTPILLGVIPFGMVAGVSAVSVNIPPFEAVAMSMVVFAGAAQLASIDLIGRNAPFVIVCLTALVINLRFLMYSASLSPHFKGLPLRWKGLLAYMLTDQAYVMSITRYSQPGGEQKKHWYYAGAALTLWVAWLVSTTVGALLGAQVPSSWSLDFAVPLTFMALLFPVIKDRANLLAALVSGVTAVAASGLPYNLGLMLASILGILVGTVVEGKES